jgi:ADP-dependent NAD(P)H-hydrate dehydratase / NAD(P)H-hydrate epimerase
MNIVDSKTMAKIDAKTISEGFSSEKLMENAGIGAFNEIINRFNLNKKFLILIGPGNNGGDGFVISRLLLQKNYEVETFVCCEKEKIKGDSKINFEKLNKTKSPLFISQLIDLKKHFENTENDNVIIDALFGTGLSKNLEGFYLEIVNFINSLSNYKISIDIPSGVNGSTGQICGAAVQSDLTLTFALYKFGQFIHPGKKFSGEVKLIDIGIPDKIISQFNINDKLLTSEYLKPKFIKRKPDSHKYDYGHALIFAGGRGKLGAGILTARGALKAGAGLVTLLVPDSIFSEAQVKAPLEIMVESFSEKSFSSFKETFSRLNKISVIGAGPGIGVSPLKQMIVGFLLQQNLPVVIDADAIKIIKDFLPLFKERSNETILTPHMGEFSNLIGKEKDFVLENKLSLAINFSKDYSINLLLKGDDTLICSKNGSVRISEGGSPAISNAGQGDALTGFITGLISSGYNILDAAEISASIQGRLGNYLSEKNGPIGVLASEIIDSFPQEYKKLFL